MLPKIELRGQPFTMRPEMEEDGRGGVRPSTTEMLVATPGFEDWSSWGSETVLVKKARGWRPYLRETIESYSTSFGHGGHCVHARYHAIRSSLDGKPLGNAPSAEAALARLQAAFLADEVLPA